MNLTLHPEDEKLIEEKVRSGQYPNAAALIAEALHALIDREAVSGEERARIRKLLDDRWAEANDSGTHWADGEEALDRLEAKVSTHEDSTAKGR
jgi:Arc/MetJ-type ribon-helix-helix transcriptional regulator